MKSVILCGLSAFCIFLTGLALPTSAAGPFTQQEIADKGAGELVYDTYCVGCHGTSESRAPLPSVLRMMSADKVMGALTEGVMRDQGELLSAGEKAAVAEYLTQKRLGAGERSANIAHCERHDFDYSKPVAVRDWGFDLNNTRSQSLQQAGLQAGDMARLEVAWALVLPDAIQLRSQPTFAGGWLFMGSQDGTVYGLDAKTGCLHWSYHAVSEVRTTIGITAWDAADPDPQPLAIFGDHLGNVYGVKARTGELVWKTRPHTHPNATVTGSPRVVGDVVYVPFASHEDIAAGRADYECCTFRGGVAKLDALTGETIWLGHSVAQVPTAQKINAAGAQQYGPSGASIWNSPAVDLDRNQLYVGTGDNYSMPATGTSDAVIAFDLTTGKQRWVYQATPGGDAWNTACMASNRGPNCPEEEGPDFDIGTGMILFHPKDSRPVVLAGQKSGDAFALDPGTGKEIWRIKLGRGGIQGGIHFGMAVADGVAYIPVSDMVYDGDAGTYEGEPRPGLFAVDLKTGEELWAWQPTEDICQGRDFCDPGISAPPTVIGDHVIVGALDGVLRVHEAATGKVVWALDTTQTFTGINGFEGHGGSMNAIGPVAHDGRVYVASGYAFAGHMPGNVLLVLKPARNASD